MAIEGKVKLPVVGEVDKKYAIAGTVAAGGIAAVVYVKRRKAAAANTAVAAAGTQTDPAGNVGTIDPATGYVYGSPQDTQNLAMGAGPGGGGYGSTYGGNNTVDPVTGYPYGSIADQNALGTSSGTSASGITTNSSWLAEATGALPGDTATITSALASVLGGLTVTSAQRDLFMEAVGILGPPPQGYPTPIKLSDTPAQPTPTPTGGGGGNKGGGGGGGGGGPTPVNPGFSVVGDTLAAATSVINGAGYHINNKSGNLAGKVVSQTAYSDKSINLGFS